MPAEMLLRMQLKSDVKKHALPCSSFDLPRPFLCYKGLTFDWL